MTPPAMAGSMDSRFRMLGSRLPETTATTRLITKATAMTPPSIGSRNAKLAAKATRLAQSTPFRMATRNSRFSKYHRLARLMWPSTMPRITRVRVWVPAMPPMLATTGSSTASATTLAMVASKTLMTAAARKAVMRLTPSHTARRRADLSTGAKVSSSGSRPARASTASSASSAMTSTTSSMVMRPTSLPSPSSTGADTRSSSLKTAATSRSGMSTWMAVEFASITSRTVTLASEVRMRDNDRVPTNSLLLLTTMSASVCLGSSLRRRK